MRRNVHFCRTEELHIRTFHATTPVKRYRPFTNDYQKAVQLFVCALQISVSWTFRDHGTPNNSILPVRNPCENLRGASLLTSLFFFLFFITYTFEMVDCCRTPNDFFQAFLGPLRVIRGTQFGKHRCRSIEGHSRREGYVYGTRPTTIAFIANAQLVNTIRNTNFPGVSSENGTIVSVCFPSYPPAPEVERTVCRKRRYCTRSG